MILVLLRWSCHLDSTRSSHKNDSNDHWQATKQRTDSHARTPPVHCFVNLQTNKHFVNTPFAISVCCPIICAPWTIIRWVGNYEGRLGVPRNKGTWPKLKKNTGTSGLIRSASTFENPNFLVFSFFSVKFPSQKLKISLWFPCTYIWRQSSQNTVQLVAKCFLSSRNIEMALWSGPGQTFWLNLLLAHAHLQFHRAAAHTQMSQRV